MSVGGVQIIWSKPRVLRFVVLFIVMGGGMDFIFITINLVLNFGDEGFNTRYFVWWYNKIRTSNILKIAPIDFDNHLLKTATKIAVVSVHFS